MVILKKKISVRIERGWKLCLNSYLQVESKKEFGFSLCSQMRDGGQ